MNRIIVGTTDRSKELDNYNLDTVALNGSTPIYVSSFFKFNHIYIDLSTVETVAVTNLKVYLCTGDSFEEVTDVIDETYGFTRSGFITFTPNKDSAWNSQETELITELNAFRINPRYWVKIVATFDAAVASWIGCLFSDDNELKMEFNDLCNATVYSALGVTSHKLKHIRAAELIVNQLKTGNTIVNESQLLSRSDYRPAAVMKVAEMIYFELGEAYSDQYEKCQKEFNLRMAKTQPKIDKNNTATEVKYSSSFAQGRLTR